MFPTAVLPKTTLLVNSMNSIAYSHILLWKLLVFIAIVSPFILFAYFIKRIIQLHGGQKKQTAAFFKNSGRISFIGIVCIGVLSALATIGVNIFAVVTSFGLVGLAVGFAAQDYISNLIAGVMILISSPYKIGNKITLDSFQGTIQYINLRATILENEDEQIIIPNATLLKKIVQIKKETKNSTTQT